MTERRLEKPDFSQAYIQNAPESQAIFRFLRSLSAHYQKIQRELTDAEWTAFRALTQKGAVEGIMRSEWTTEEGVHEIKFEHIAGDYIRAMPNSPLIRRDKPIEVDVIQARLTGRGEGWAGFLRNEANHPIPARTLVLTLLHKEQVEPGRVTAVKGPVERQPSELVAPLPQRIMTKNPEPPKASNPSQNTPAQNVPEVPKYEQDAYLSHIQALRECPSLDTPRKAYDWIKQNGVEIDGRSYTLPPFDTWRKYRSEGERKAKPAPE